MMHQYKDKYEFYLSQVSSDIDRARNSDTALVIGYTSNLDIILEWNVDAYNRLLEKYFVTDNVYYNKGERICSLNDFARITAYFMIHGMGGEIDAETFEMVEILKQYFNTRNMLGGTCAQSAAALGAVGMPALIHLTDQCREVCEFLNYAGLEVVTSKGRHCVMETEFTMPPAIHLILQFSKGDVIKVKGVEYKLPLSNRLILDCEMIQKTVPISSCFFDYCEKNASDIRSYSVSGLNAIIDKNILKERILQLYWHLTIVKDKNPDCMVYFESAHYLSNEMRRLVYLFMLKVTDILGMNEEELMDFGDNSGVIIEKASLASVIKGLDHMLTVYPLMGIVLHTKDYAMYYGQKLVGIDIEKGITMGNLMSATRAKTGKYGSLQDCNGSLDLGFSKIGLAFYDQLQKMRLRYTAVLVPSRYIENPECTIGLGDTFTAGVQICF